MGNILFQIIVFMYLLLATQKTINDNFIIENFIIAWWVLHIKVDLKKPGIKIIILSSVIQMYKMFFHPKSKYYLLIQIRVCMCECCISAKIMHSSLLSWRERFLERLKYQSYISKTIGLVKFPIIYLRYIKILSCHMVSICFRQHMIWQ